MTEYKSGSSEVVEQYITKLSEENDKLKKALKISNKHIL